MNYSVRRFSEENSVATLKSIVDNEIREIEIRRAKIINEAKANFALLAESVRILDSVSYLSDVDNIESLSGIWQLNRSYTFLLWEERTGVILGSAGYISEYYTYDELQDLLESQPLYEQVTLGQRIFAFFMSEEALYERIMEETRIAVHSKVYPNDGYIWINEIRDYNGGDNYAVRLIHSNLKNSEGELLSTKTKDANGNTPYLEELNAINECGEVLQSYYFKELSSDNESLKISYGKLYPDYNWVVLSGMYINKIDEMARYVTDLNEGQRQGWVSFLLAMGISLMFVSMAAFIFLERKSFAETSTSYRHLEEEKQLLEGEAHIDVLTGCKNRRSMGDCLSEGFLRFQYGGEPISLLMLDIDNFKSVNDTYGHSAGDLVLKRVAQAALDVTRTNDAVCRWGGEEFIVLLEGASQRVASVIAERVRQDIEDSRIEVFAQTLVSVTVSIGVSEYYEGDSSYLDAVNRADKAMYSAKKSGKNRVLVYSGTFT